MRRINKFGRKQLCDNSNKALPLLFWLLKSFPLTFNLWNGVFGLILAALNRISHQNYGSICNYYDGQIGLRFARHGYWSKMDETLTSQALQCLIQLQKPFYKGLRKVLTHCTFLVVIHGVFIASSVFLGLSKSSEIFI